MHSENVENSDLSLSQATGKGGVVVVDGQTKTIPGPVAGLCVVSGDATVSGASVSEDTRAEPLAAVAFGAGTFVLPLKDVEVIATGATLVYLA